MADKPRYLRSKQRWCRTILREFSPKFAKLGHPLPANITVHCAWDRRGRLHNQGIDKDTDGLAIFDTNDIYICPSDGGTLSAIITIIHEGAHLASRNWVHGRTFSDLCLSLGLDEKGLYVNSLELMAEIFRLISIYGYYPGDPAPKD